MNPVTNRTILIVEDDKVLLTEIADFFLQHNTVSVAGSLSRAVELAKNRFFDIVILDMLLPDGFGLDLIEYLQKDTPVLVLSTINAEETMIECFSSGVCDYVVKPCSMELLNMRIALRLMPPKQAIISLHGITLDSRLRTVTYQYVPIKLTSCEFNILHFLMKNAGTFYSTADIYLNVWKAPSLMTTSIRYHLHNLRRKLAEASGGAEELIITEFGKGYAFAAGIDDE